MKNRAEWYQMLGKASTKIRTSYYDKDYFARMKLMALLYALFCRR